MAPRSPEQFEKMRNDRRKAIMDAAFHVFAEEGYHSASVSKIARKAGVSKGLMYNYFESKEELLVKLMEEAIQERMKAYPLTESDTYSREEFIGFINMSMDLVASEPQYWRLYFSIFMQPEALEILMCSMMKYSTPYMTRLTNYFKTKDYNDPIAAMRYFSAAVDGVQMHIMLDPENFPIEKAKKLLIEQFG